MHGSVPGPGRQPWLYVWGAVGDLTNPAGELTAMWDANDMLANLPDGLSLSPDAEPTGPLDGYLQCDDNDICAWADGSGIVVVSQSSPDQPGTIVSTGGVPALMTRSSVSRRWPR